MRQVSIKAGEEIGIGGNLRVYSASIDVVAGQQEYDLQGIIFSQSSQPWSSEVRGKQINVLRVYYKTPKAVWRFYGYYGGFNVVGNLSTYGQYADDSTFNVVPVWQNKLQAAAYSDMIYTRISHYSYDVRDNRLRLYPFPEGELTKFWFEFAVSKENYLDSKNNGTRSIVGGINNLNTLPFANIPYANINSIR